MKTIKFTISWICLTFCAILNACTGGEFSNYNTGTEMIAPEFPNDLSWLNIDSPLKLSALKGKVILLDFWTYCCINCMHIIPDLKRLEKEFADELVVIGVHSAKFEQERESENIRQEIIGSGNAGSLTVHLQGLL